jgi:hypothetical protein
MSEQIRTTILVISILAILSMFTILALPTGLYADGPTIDEVRDEYKSTDPFYLEYAESQGWPDEPVTPGATGDYAIEGTDVSFLDVTASGTVDAIAYTISGSPLAGSEEEIEDYVGGMVTGNTETGITVTYQDSDGTIDFIVGASGTAAGVRTATIIVAASDATAEEQASADYVCDGTDDHTDINSAISDASTSYGGKVQLLGNDFDIGGDVNVENCTLEGFGGQAVYYYFRDHTDTGTHLNISDNAASINVRPGGSLKNVHVSTLDNFSGTAVQVNDQAGEQIADQAQILFNVSVRGATANDTDPPTGTGIAILGYGYSSSEGKLVMSSFWDLNISLYDYGLVVWAYNDGTYAADVNGNEFIGGNIADCRVGILLNEDDSGGGGSQVQGNHFVAYQIQPTQTESLTDYYVYITGGADFNQFTPFYGWDFNSSSMDDIIYFGTGCWYNLVQGLVKFTDGGVTDVDDKNFVLDQYSPSGIKWDLAGADLTDCDECAD